MRPGNLIQPGEGVTLSKNMGENRKPEIGCGGKNFATRSEQMVQLLVMKTRRMAHAEIKWVKELDAQ
jgi:hypothetical protein